MIIEDGIQEEDRAFENREAGDLCFFSDNWVQRPGVNLCFFDFFVFFSLFFFFLCICIGSINSICIPSLVFVPGFTNDKQTSASIILALGREISLHFADETIP